MRVFIGIVALVLALPIVFVIGIALGPAILVIVFIGLCAVPVLLIEGVWLRRRRYRRVPPAL